MRLGPRLVASASTAARMAERLRTTSPVRKCVNLSANPVQPSTSASKSVMWTLGKKLLSSHLYRSSVSVTRRGDSRIGVCLIQGGERRRFAMPIPLRADFDARMARAAGRGARDGPQSRRFLARAEIYDGASRTEAAKIGGVTLQIVRDWVMKFNAHGAEGLLDRKAPGQPSRLNDVHRAALAAIIESGPTPAVLGGVRWRMA